MVKIPSRTLMGVAGIGGMILGVTGLAMHKRLQQQFKESPSVKNSLKLLQSHRGAEYLLGKPIKDFHINLTDREGVTKTESQAVYKIPVKGPKGHGFYYLHTVVDGSNWLVTRCELELGETTQLEKEKYQDKRLVVFDVEKHGDLASAVAAKHGDLASAVAAKQSAAS